MLTPLNRWGPNHNNVYQNCFGAISTLPANPESPVCMILPTGSTPESSHTHTHTDTHTHTHRQRSSECLSASRSRKKNCPPVVGPRASNSHGTAARSLLLTVTIAVAVVAVKLARSSTNAFSTSRSISRRGGSRNASSRSRTYGAGVWGLVEPIIVMTQKNKEKLRPSQQQEQRSHKCSKQVGCRRRFYLVTVSSP